ncbi:ACT domain-containing protein [Roridomyces roridus]|uniref:ACT domain-containing protein n=1 Tax=Roridomyces roridus TaxID=1738132 RepID=A0AAD7B611_9AGAR|nr:ACT domain-containing protein [Roridomyces roridus]
MAPPIDHPCLLLHLLPDTFFVRKFEPSKIGETFQDLLSKDDGGFLSITRTSEELSVVGRYKDGMEGYEEFATWRAFKIAGPMEFDLVGVLTGFLEPLKRANIGIFAVSTWNTDYILVAKEKADAAVAALEGDGWKFASK